MSERAEGLQQLDALASLCEQRQLIVNLSKTKVVLCEARRSDVSDFVFDSTLAKRVDSYKYLGFVFHSTKDMKIGTAFLVAAAWKALYAMRRQCPLPGLKDPAKQCKLFDTLVLPIVSYACEVWGISPSVGEAAEVLYRGFLKHLLCVRTSATIETIFAEFGRFPLQIHCWQQNLQYHHRTAALDNTFWSSLQCQVGVPKQ